MERVLACLLLALRLSPGGATVKETPGGVCPIWTPDRRQFVAGFTCPGKNDSRDAVFCCGTCITPHCCASEEDQLDPQGCYLTLQLPTTPAPVLLPQDWYFIYFVMGMVAIAAVIVCANYFSTQIRDCLRRTFCCLQTACWPCQAAPMVQMGTQPTASIMDECPSGTCTAIPTVSTCAEESDGAWVSSPALDATPVRGLLRTQEIPENEAIWLPAAVQNTSVCCPILEDAVAMEVMALETCL